MLLHPATDPNRGSDPGLDQHAEVTPARSAGTAMRGLAEPATIAERMTRGTGLRFATDGAIIPITEPWGQRELLATIGPFGTEIAGKLNNGWSLTLYPYRADDGRIAMVILRMDHPTGAEPKLVRPLHARGMRGILPDVGLGTLPPPRPLYNLHQLAARPAAPVLAVEGEKAAEAAAQHFPDHVATTWPGGADGIGSTDLRALKGRQVIVWPDHDEAGAGAARKLGRALLDVGAASVRLVRVPAHFPPKWDVADPVPEAPRG